MGPKYILLKPKIYFSNNILLFGNFAATPLQTDRHTHTPKIPSSRAPVGANNHMMYKAPAEVGQARFSG